MGKRTAPKPRHVTFFIHYPGKVISVNHYLGRRRDGSSYVKREAREWMDELGWTIKLAHIEDWRLPLEVWCAGFFANRREAPDLSNLSKCTLDAIQEVTGLNDRDFRWHDGDRLIRKNAEVGLIITIKEAGGGGMTKEETLAMKTEIELDNATHREVMGKGEPSLIHPLPKYSTDISAAWLVVEAMRNMKDEEGNLLICCLTIQSDYNYVWDIEWSYSELSSSNDGHKIHRLPYSFEELPEAICKAALLAKLEEG